MIIQYHKTYIMCHRLIHERNESGLCVGMPSKQIDSSSFEISTDGNGELDIVTPLADTIDEGEDG